MSANKGKYLIIVAGPTAVGKTNVAINLAKDYDAEIFSCDSRQLYEEMNIGTAKPSNAELKEVRHHFIDTISVQKAYTTGDYERDIDAALNVYFKTKDIAILTGGTGLYIKAVTEGLDDFPIVDDKILETLSEQLSNKGIEYLNSELERLDPITHSKIDLQNDRRVIRALSVCLSEGKPYSSYLRQTPKQLTYYPIFIVLEREREELYKRINSRVDQMMDRGLLTEADTLQGFKTLPALQTVGYNELFDYFDGKLSLTEAIDLIKRNSRRYAKRQMTWFRNQGNYKSFHPEKIDEIKNYLAEIIS